MQQVAALEVVGGAQVEVERLLQRLGLQAQPLLCLLDVALQRHGGHIRRHRAKPVADHQRVVDELQHRVAPIVRTVRVASCSELSPRAALADTSSGASARTPSMVSVMLAGLPSMRRV